MMGNFTGILSDYTFQVVALASGILGLLSGIVGVFATLKKESLLGDTLSHAALPGIGAAFLFSTEKNLLSLLIGATLSGLLATATINLLRSKNIVKSDSALAIVLSSFFGVGLVLKTYIQRQPNANQAGLDRFIFGQASTMLIEDVYLTAGVGFFMLLLVFVYWKELKVFTFDSAFTQTLGFSSRVMNTIISIMIVITVVIGLQSVGVILISALLIGPAVAARQWSNHLSIIVFLSGIIGFLSGIIGTAISSIYSDLPTGPVIVLISSLFVFGSLFFSPKRGWISKRLLQRRRKKQLILELAKGRRENDR